MSDYPKTRRDDTADVLHGRRVADPYRWLEDPDSDETAAWVAEQNALSQEHLAGLASRPWFRKKMRDIVLRPRAGVPNRKAGRYFVSRNDGTLQQDQWFVADSLDELRAGGRLLVDPNTFSEDGTSSLAGYTVSDDGRWFAYLVSDGGSDWNTIRLVDLTDGSDAPDVLVKSKFSEATWLPDNRSFLYLHYATEGTGVGTEAAALPGGRLLRHRLGTPQEDDELVLEFPDNPQMFVEPVVSHDGRWLFAHLNEGTEEHNRLWAYRLGTEAGETVVGEPLLLVDDVHAVHAVIRTDGDRVLLRTDADAPLGKVVALDLAGFAETGEARFEDVVAETDAALELATAAGDEIVAVHLVDAQPRVRRFGLDGSARGDVAVEGGSVLAVRGEVGSDEAFIGLSSVMHPVAAYRLGLGDGSVEALADLVPEGAVAFSPPELVTERRRATSKDGTEVPYFLIRSADVDLDAPRPTLLYGYGGFNIPVLADYRAVFAGWLAAGGVLAIANLRGGSEYGATWHDAGRLKVKQNVFDDFAAVAEHLASEGVTTASRLALHGGSNGGLLVGAALTQRPDLAAVALPAVGVLDMLRFHLFTVGAAWVSDFGSPDDPEMFETLLAYSPLHNIEEGTSYPATLVLTGDHDDRVVPAHSFKFVAELQRAQGGNAPVLARIETSTGHGAGKPAAVLADEAADLLAFAAEHTGLVPSPE